MFKVALLISAVAAINIQQDGQTEKSSPAAVVQHDGRGTTLSHQIDNTDIDASIMKTIKDTVLNAQSAGAENSDVDAGADPAGAES